jgi:hypothetical protein
LEVEMDKTRMGFVWFAFLVTTFALITLGGECDARAEVPVPADQWTDETRLWLARSLVGEVGWRRPEEQAAVAWVYATRARSSSKGFGWLLRRYSAAIRAPGLKRQPWIGEIRDHRRPPSWPRGPLWKGLHDQAWLDVLELVDGFEAGLVPNPCPEANHYGGPMDAWRADAARWARVCRDKRFRNHFYSSTRLRKTVKRSRSSRLDEMFPERSKRAKCFRR